MKSAAPLIFPFLGQDLLLLPEKGIFWQNQKTLILADIHLGKVGHFRKAGIGIPKKLEQDDLAAISDLIHLYQPDHIIFLGDLFHSELNRDWDWLVLWRDMFPQIRMTLVVGNHDILNESHYLDLRFELHDELLIEPFLFSHKPLSEKRLEAVEAYVLAGHIHPGVTLKGSARQFLSLPCFHFGRRQGVLPAFGKFTGKACVKNIKGDQVFGILKDRVVAL